MSIAVSAVIRPSRLLRAAQALLCVAVLSSAVLVPHPLACVAVVAGAIAGAACGLRIVKSARIDISGVGLIRVTVYHVDDVPCPAPMRLMPGSTLWPGLLLLRLRGEGGTVWLAVLPDSAAPAVRRRLAVAARAIAARG